MLVEVLDFGLALGTFALRYAWPLNRGNGLGLDLLRLGLCVSPPGGIENEQLHAVVAQGQALLAPPRCGELLLVEPGALEH